MDKKYEGALRAWKNAFQERRAQTLFILSVLNLVGLLYGNLRSSDGCGTGSLTRFGSTGFRVVSYQNLLPRPYLRSEGICESFVDSGSTSGPVSFVYELRLHPVGGYRKFSSDPLSHQEHRRRQNYYHSQQCLQYAGPK